MAHFCKIGKGNKVEKVEVVSNDIATTEQAGVEFLQNLYKDRAVWKQTSYNTRKGQHRLGGTPFRKNYGNIGYRYDDTLDAFIPPKPFNSWKLNDDTYCWEAPVPMPEYTQEQIDNGNKYIWNEDNQTWNLI